MTVGGKDNINIEVSRILPAKKWKVLRLITRVQHFPQYMPNVKHCTVLEKSARGAVTSWNVEIDGMPFTWKEKDEFDFPNFKVHFKAIEGDLEHFEGTWQLKDHPGGGTEVTVYVSARLGIPLVTEIVGDVIAEKLKKNFEIMLSTMCDMLTMQRYKNIRDRRVSDLKGFAVIGHPYNFQHLVRYFKYFKPDFKLPSQDFLAKLFELTPSYKSYDIRTFRSATGKEVNGYYIMCPIIPDMLVMNADQVVKKVIQACRISETLGVGIVVLGGFTSIAGELYSRSLVSEINVPVTTGNTLTVSLVLDGIYKASELMEIDLSQAKITVIGGTGDIGGSVARILSKQVREITVTSRSEKNLMEAERVLSYYGKADIKTSRDNNEAIKGADIILAAASVSSSMIDFNNFKPGAVICDVGYPKNISYTMCTRNDILIFSGGIAQLPSDFNLGFDIGLPTTNVLYGCFAEAILLALEERYENFSWGKGNVNEDRIRLIREAALKHGFKLAPFFWGNRLVGEQGVKQIKERAREEIAKSFQKW